MERFSYSVLRVVEGTIESSGRWVGDSLPLIFLDEVDRDKEENGRIWNEKLSEQVCKENYIRTFNKYVSWEWSKWNRTNLDPNKGDLS